jgi:hypothetical protein
MASTNILYSVTPATNYYIGSNPATPDFDGDVLVLDFDASTDEFAEFLMFLPAHYGATTGITFSLLWSADTATSGNCIWNIAISSLTGDTDNAGTKAFSAVNAVTDAAPGTAGIIAYATITFTDGADMDSWATGEWAKVRLSRDADNASDTMTGDAQFHALVMTET